MSTFIRYLIKLIFHLSILNKLQYYQRLTCDHKYSWKQQQTRRGLEDVMERMTELSCIHVWVCQRKKEVELLEQVQRRTQRCSEGELGVFTWR